MADFDFDTWRGSDSEYYSDFIDSSITNDAADLFGDIFDTDFLSDNPDSGGFDFGDMLFGNDKGVYNFDIGEFTSDGFEQPQIEYDWNAPGASDFDLSAETSSYYDNSGGIGGFLGSIVSGFKGMSPNTQSLISSALMGGLQGAMGNKAQRNATAAAAAQSQAQWERLMKAREVPALDKLRASGGAPFNAGYFGVKFGGK